MRSIYFLLYRSYKNLDSEGGYITTPPHTQNGSPPGRPGGCPVTVRAPVGTPLVSPGV